MTLLTLYADGETMSMMFIQLQRNTTLTLQIPARNSWWIIFMQE